MQYDGIGITGSLVHYMLILSLVGSAFIVFFYLWVKGRLGIDEDAAIEMMKSDENSEEKK